MYSVSICRSCCVLSGISVVYFLCLVFMLFQNYKDVNEIMYWLYPDLRNEKPDDKVWYYCGCVYYIIYG